MFKAEGDCKKPQMAYDNGIGGFIGSLITTQNRVTKGWFFHRFEIKMRKGMKIRPVCRF